MRNLILSALILASALQTAMGDKFKAVMVACILFASGLHADDDKARMERNKICNKTASELTTEYPKTVRAVQQSNAVKTAEEYGIVDLWVEVLTLAIQKNPQLASELVKVGQIYQDEDRAKSGKLFKEPAPNLFGEPETNSVSNHNHSK